MRSTLEAARQLKIDLEAALGDLVDLVTLDGAGIKPATRAAVEIYPPDVTYTTWDDREVTWTLVAVAGPADRPLIAWDALDQILTRLEARRLNLARATPATYGLAGSSLSLPAYEITLNPLEY